MNFYTANPGNGILGWATYPADFDGDPEKDGVVILHSTFPGGATAPYNRGHTATHEIGHWLGLYHTFQSGNPLGGSGCVPPGDEVDDTPPHSGPNMKCDAGDSCEKVGDGQAPIHNYMNYTPDDCMTEFTMGQRLRMMEQVGTFRSPLIH